MILKCNIIPGGYKTIHELPNSWSNKNYIDLLQIMGEDIEEISETEAQEYCLLALAEYDKEDAANIVLEYLFGKDLTDGQINNLVEEIQNENLWEEYADLSMHEIFFNAHQLLYNAYNGGFPYPKAITFNFEIHIVDQKHQGIINDLDEKQIIKLLVKGLPTNTVINRVFKDQLLENDFEEAKDIIWQHRMLKQADNWAQYEIISSEYWLHDFKYLESFNSSISFEDALV